MRRALASSAALFLAVSCAGRARAQVSTASARAIIAVDAGHGGEDLGAVISYVREKELTSRIALALAKAVDERPGLRSLQLRPEDRYTPLVDRVAAAQAAGAAALVSIHLDDRRSPKPRSGCEDCGTSCAQEDGGRGVSVYYYGRSRERYRRLILPEPPRKQIRASGDLARSVYRALRERGLRTCTVDRGSYVILKGAKVPSILVEAGNMRDSRETARLKDPAFERRLAEAVALGVERYLSRTP
ncbi:MAG: N-acetylmuramoyl-L-alanine amidase [Elusimicrobiota bacterium]|jgi:N-acetylmuramoyl-L-alanine amidase